MPAEEYVSAFVKLVNPHRIVRAIYHNGEEHRMRHSSLDEQYEWEDRTKFGDEMETFCATFEKRRED